MTVTPRWLGQHLCREMAGQPLVDGLVAGLRGLIIDGRLLTGSKLAAERDLAQAIGVSRSTVTAAYDELRGEGYLLSRHGSGTFVALPRRRVNRPDEPVGPRSDLLDLTVAALPAPPEVAVAAQRAAQRLTSQLHGNGLEPAGLEELRTAVAARYGQRGLPTTAEQILVTSGALHGWDLLLRAVAKPGAHVVVEQPTYPAIIDAALAHRVRLHPLPIEQQSWQLDALPTVPVALVHLTLDGQNPTGAWAGDAIRRRILRAFDPATVIAVDETMADFPRHAPVSRPAPAYARPGSTVVAIGSMSKSFWAGLRIGWIRAPEPVVRRLTAVRAGQDLAPPVLDQLLAVELLGQFADVVAERQALVAERYVALRDAVASALPEWSLAEPLGGLAAWVDLGAGSSTRLAAAAYQHGVRVTPGPRFTIAGSHDRYLRLPFVLPPDQLRAAVDRLAAAAADLGPVTRRGRQSAETAWTA